jgi:hypothetical protein
MKGQTDLTVSNPRLPAATPPDSPAKSPAEVEFPRKKAKLLDGIICDSKSGNRVEFPLQEAKSIDGIISYLSRKCDGNVHKSGLVTISSKAVWKDKHGDEVMFDSDLRSCSCFGSTRGEDEWIHCDFNKRHIRNVHYALEATPTSEHQFEMPFGNNFPCTGRSM